MTDDPTFSTQEQFNAWHREQITALLRANPGTFAGLDIAATISRVTAAHTHLLKERRDDR